LEIEYGYILPVFEHLHSLDIITVPLEMVKMNNESYMRKLNKEMVDQYNGYELPRAVCINEGDMYYRVIDGFHRMTSAYNQKLKEVSIIVMHK